ncbi:MAG: pyridoxamine 5'-phosphate oxidase family protein [Sandaracinus sp.]|nr:pyridoxamine 5'-phosphate oxidase family protein [Sandaracinus sp.]MCB9631486.1 pyridoxamine 5'-phosphate oxidase family protein [Sandaracinus sp.]
MSDSSPFHAGELALQRSVGSAEKVDAYARRAIRDFLTEQHRDFFAQLPFVVAATVDEAGDVWATMLTGAPGFVSSPDPRTLHVAAGWDVGDPAREGGAVGRSIGLLGLEPTTRRRNRLNGLVRSTDGGLLVEVRESFGNCPQFIRQRDVSLARVEAAPPEELSALDDEARALVSGADTFFVGSYADVEGTRRVDVSHRGGRPGFVKVSEAGVLTVPDFAGNNLFNTLGNFLVNPRAGLLFVDFESGDVLQLVGDVEVRSDASELATFRGAQRLWTVRPRRIVRRRGATLRARAREDGVSPSTLRTGSWDETG